MEAPEAGVLEGREVPPTLPNAGSSFENPESRRRYPARDRDLGIVNWLVLNLPQQYSTSSSLVTTTYC